MDQEINVPQVGQQPRRRPRYILGTFWLGVALLGFIAGFSTGEAAGFLLGLAAGAYCIYLYRGGRYGFIVW
jgi:hypothetical protein